MRGEKRYYPQIWSEIGGITYTHAYFIGALVLAMFDTQQFAIYASEQMKLAFDVDFTTSPERLIEGMEHLVELTDWHKLATSSRDDEANNAEIERLLPLVEQIYAIYFGCRFRMSI
jgi:hypothetical protein